VYDPCISSVFNLNSRSSRSASLRYASCRLRLLSRGRYLQPLFTSSISLSASVLARLWRVLLRVRSPHSSINGCERRSSWRIRHFHGGFKHFGVLQQQGCILWRNRAFCLCQLRGMYEFMFPFDPSSWLVLLVGYPSLSTAVFTCSSVYAEALASIPLFLLSVRKLGQLLQTPHFVLLWAHFIC
jgi:hypothetical protein